MQELWEIRANLICLAVGVNNDFKIFNILFIQEPS